MLWNFLNHRIVYFVSNCAGLEGAKNNGLVSLKCIKKGCKYHLICKRGIINFFSFDIHYYYVDLFIDHTCDKISTEDKTKLRNISDCWRDTKELPLGNGTYSRNQIVRHFISVQKHKADISAGTSSSPLPENAVLENTETYRNLSTWFEGFKILESTASCLRNSLQPYFVYVMNPAFLNSTKRYETEDLLKAFAQLYSFHPYFSSEKNKEENIRRFLKQSRNHFQDSKTIICDIAGVFLHTIMRKPNSSFFVRYDSLSSAIHVDKKKSKRLKKER